MKFTILFVGLFALTLFAGSVLPAEGAAFLKYGDIKGESTTEGYEDWISIDSVQFDVGRTISSSGGAGGARDAGNPSLSEITVTKVMDTSSVDLFREALVGTASDSQIDLLELSDGRIVTFYEIILTNSLISSYSLTSNADDRPTESISLNYAQIEVRFTPHDSKGGAGQPIVADYDILSGKGQ